MHMRNFICPLMQIAVFLLFATTVQAGDVAYVAGTHPAERPATAPTVTEVTKDATWYPTALQGVEQPYPHSLHFLENQGNWFTPFTRAGMFPPYDLRGWHTNK